MDYRSEAPPILRDFLAYHENIKNHSQRTIDEYYLDLRMFFRYLKKIHGLISPDAEFNDIPIYDVELSLLAGVTLADVYGFLTYLSRDRVKSARSSSKHIGLSATTRARKIAVIRSLYKYLTVKAHLIEENPLQGLDSPKTQQSLPRYLSLDESRRLLESVDGKNSERDYCIICIFLNCGLRISEIVGLNISDIREDHLRVLGKGNKERVVYLNDACADAINSYLIVRKNIAALDKDAMFLSNRRTRISRESIHHMVKKTLLRAGLDASKFSSHKLRHTAATLMLQNGVDVRTLQELLGHEHLNTTQIYTHVDNTELRTAARANPLGSFKQKKSDN